MHQKNKAAVPLSSNLDDDDNDDGANDPFADGEGIDDDEGEPTARDGGRGAWWRSIVASEEKGRDYDSDEDEEFGDFAMADNDKGGDDRDDNVILKPLAVNPTKDSTRGLSGLWPFNNKGGSQGSQEDDADTGSEDKSLPHASGEKGEEASRAVEVKEAKRRTSIEDPEDEEVVV